MRVQSPSIGEAISYAKSMGIEKVCYPLDWRNAPSKKIALFYNGKFRTAFNKLETADGRILEEEIYDIEIL